MVFTVPRPPLTTAPHTTPVKLPNPSTNTPFRHTLSPHPFIYHVPLTTPPLPFARPYHTPVPRPFTTPSYHLVRNAFKVYLRFKVKEA